MSSTTGGSAEDETDDAKVLFVTIQYDTLSTTMEYMPTVQSFPVSVLEETTIELYPEKVTYVSLRE